MERSPQLSVELVWEDSDLEELCISADNGQYSGVTNVYFGQGECGALAQSLQGFPKSISQEEIFEGGSDDGPFGKLFFRCIDGSGHTIVRVTLQELVAFNLRSVIPNRVELEFQFEASALDEFCAELQAVARRERRRAVLKGIAA
jgi:hypothetical protein